MTGARRPLGPAAVGYARHGADEDPEELEEQVAVIEAYARFRGLQLERVFRDPGVPGNAPLEARPGGNDLVSWLGKKHRHYTSGIAVLVVRLEPMFSSAAECVSYLESWEEHGVVLHVLDLAGSAVDTASPAGHFLLAVLRAARDMELEQTVRGSGADDMASRREGRPLLGERIVRGYLVPDPAELRAVERIQELSEQGKSLRLIAEALDNEGIPTKRRAKAWSKEAIRLILRRIEKGEIASLRDEASRTSVNADERPTGSPLKTPSTRESS